MAAGPPRRTDRHLALGPDRRQSPERPGALQPVRARSVVGIAQTADGASGGLRVSRGRPEGAAAALARPGKREGGGTRAAIAARVPSPSRLPDQNPMTAPPREAPHLRQVFVSRADYGLVTVLAV